MEAARLNAVKKFVYASSSSVYVEILYYHKRKGEKGIYFRHMHSLKSK